MADSLLLPPPLVGDERFQALAQLAARMSDIDLSPLLVYLVDSVPDSALPDLAEQLHILGEGWNLATTEQSRRSLIKAAIDLHRHKGTLYAVSLAIELMGLTGHAVEWFNYGGSPFHFKISAAIPPGRSFTETDWQTLLARVEDAKNIRSHLEGISLSAETSGTSHRVLHAHGIGDTLAYPVQPAELSPRGERRPAIWFSSAVDLCLYPHQPSLVISADRMAAPIISSTTTSILYPEPS